MFAKNVIKTVCPLTNRVGVDFLNELKSSYSFQESDLFYEECMAVVQGELTIILYYATL